MASYDATHSLRFEGSYVAAKDNVDATVIVADEDRTEYAAGTGSNQCNALYDDSFSTTSTAPISLNLLSGMTDVHGVALVFAKVRGIRVRIVTATTLRAIALSGLFPSAYTLGEWVYPGGVWYHENPLDGWSIISGISNTLILTPSTGSALSFNVRIWGTV